MSTAPTLPDLTAQQARVLLLVSLEGQTVAELCARLEERGHFPEPEHVKRALDRLTRTGLLACEKGKRGNRYRLSSGAEVETALDVAYALAGATAAP